MHFAENAADDQPHDATHQGIKKDVIPADIACGSQYDNAVMVGEADRVIVL